MEQQTATQTPTLPIGVVGKLLRVSQPIYGFLPSGNHIKFRRGDLLVLLAIIATYNFEAPEDNFRIKFLTQHGLVAYMEVTANSYLEAFMILKGFMQDIEPLTEPQPLLTVDHR